MFALAHLSDPHLPMPPWTPSAIRGKRAFGYASWIRRRRRVHRPEVLAALIADIRAHRPDHIAVTGDITNIALPEEFRLAAEWLRALGDPASVTVVPGNHEAYVAIGAAESLDLWSAYMAGDVVGPDLFPAVRARGPVALIGTSSALPTPWLRAHGTVGATQIARLRTALAEADRQDRFRVVLVHHPPVPVPGIGRRKALSDHPAFCMALREAGAELVLHGHAHRSSLGKIETEAGYAAVIGVPSASAVSLGHGEAAQWHLYRIERAAAGWEVEVTVRGLTPEAHRFRTDGRYVLRFVSSAA